MRVITIRKNRFNPFIFVMLSFFLLQCGSGGGGGDDQKLFLKDAAGVYRIELPDKFSSQVDYYFSYNDAGQIVYATYVYDKKVRESLSCEYNGTKINREMTYSGFRMEDVVYFDVNGNVSKIEGDYITLDGEAAELQSDGEVDTILTFKYNEDNRIIERKLTEFAYDPPLVTLKTYEYDDAGNIIFYSFDDEETNSSEVFTFDEFNNVLTENSYDGDELWYSRTSTLSYDLSNNLILDEGEIVNYGTRYYEIEYTYDSENRLLTETSTNIDDDIVSKFLKFTYDESGNLVKHEIDNLGYDSLTGIGYFSDGEFESTHDLFYDNSGRLTRYKYTPATPSNHPIGDYGLNPAEDFQIRYEIQGLVPNNLPSYGYLERYQTNNIIFNGGNIDVPESPCVSEVLHL